MLPAQKNFHREMNSMGYGRKNGGPKRPNLKVFIFLLVVAFLLVLFEEYGTFEDFNPIMSQDLSDYSTEELDERRDKELQKSKKVVLEIGMILSIKNPLMGNVIDASSEDVMKSINDLNDLDLKYADDLREIVLDQFNVLLKSKTESDIFMKNKFITEFNTMEFKDKDEIFKLCKLHNVKVDYEFDEEINQGLYKFEYIGY